MPKARVVNEWILTIRQEEHAGSGRIRVRMENVEARDRRFAAGLAKLVEVWLNAGRGEGASS